MAVAAAAADLLAKGTAAQGSTHQKSAYLASKDQQHLLDYLKRLSQLAATPNIMVLPVHEQRSTLCTSAQGFSEWTEQLCKRIAQNPTTITINQSKVSLLDKYMQEKSFASARHRNYTGKAHICIYHVFETAYATLRKLESALSPPLLFLPPPPAPLPAPPAPPVVRLSGLFLGENDE